MLLGFLRNLAHFLFSIGIENFFSSLARTLILGVLLGEQGGDVVVHLGGLGVHLVTLKGIDGVLLLDGLDDGAGKEIFSLSTPIGQTRRELF